MNKSHSKLAKDVALFKKFILLPLILLAAAFAPDTGIQENKQSKSKWYKILSTITAKDINDVTTVFKDFSKFVI